MDVILALQALKELLLGAAAFSGTAINAQNEGRKISPAEIAAFRASTQGALDALDAKIKAAGG